MPKKKTGEWWWPIRWRHPKNIPSEYREGDPDMMHLYYVRDPWALIHFGENRGAYIFKEDGEISVNLFDKFDPLNPLGTLWLNEGFNFDEDQVAELRMYLLDMAGLP